MSVSFSKARMFNRKASDPGNRPDDVLKALEIKPGQRIAEIGSGGGYFAFRFAEAVGSRGVVYAADANENFLNFINREAREKGLTNVRTIPLSGEDVDLPEKDLDMIFMRNVYHHLNNREDYFRKLSGFLKAGGKLAIIDHTKEKSFSFRGLFGHHTDPEIIVEELEKAGYRLEKTHDFLPRKSFSIFSKKK